MRPLALVGLLFAASGCASASIPATANGPPASPSELLQSTLDELESGGSLEQLAERAASTPGIRTVHHAEDERTLVILLDEAMSGADIATDRPSGPAPEVSSGTTGAYPVEDYYFAIERIIIRPAPGR